ncbi:DNA repair protein SWI5 homolog [Zophobas morio]|uniref:DNA repair protein SWI5 homolog n=1 Tax=Zophobas morio TaxID=2755281 RepID=UPI0030839CD5
MQESLQTIENSASKRLSSGCKNSIKRRRSIQSPSLSKPFSTPRRSCGGSPLNLEEDIKIIENELEELDEKINALKSEYDDSELSEYITLLHQYNEIKDVGQLLLGTIAEIKGVTTKKIYEEYDLEVDC